jgi:FemAB family protein
LIGTKEIPIYEPVFSKSSSKGFKRAVSTTIFSALKHVQMVGSVSTLTFTSIFPDTDELTDWQINIHKTGVECLVKYDIYVDLSRSQEELWSSIRKSYKPLINRGKKLWSIEIIDQPEVEKMLDFRKLHANEAGRITRSESTWRTQLEMIRQGNAFMIQTRTLDGELIGCALFAHSNYEAIYFSAAYRRELFNLPIAHVIQWNAICELKRRGISWYNLGEYYFPQGNNFSQKEENISFFKSGFSTNLHKRFIYR